MHAALRILPPTVGAAIFVPVDQPFLDPLLLRQLVRAWQCGASLAAPMVGDTLRGAPALFDRDLFAELGSITGDVGGRALLQRHQDEVARISTDPAWLKDIDTPADLV
jgi:CTP:molybdopterin cytidylyltransferase MocA